ncbi:MAG: alpha-D-ribose 1-methylphosphonate 5-triphosphate diphosphatase [Elainellaceae cyanobacterium]
MTEQVLTNYRLQLPTKEILGTLVIRDGHIADIQPGIVQQGQDGGGDYLIPGFVELHTDNLERCMSPRPSVAWPLAMAVVRHDRELAAAGITTVCDAIAIGDLLPNAVRMTRFDPMIDAIDEAQQASRLSVDHRLHLRCELGYEKTHDIVERYRVHPLVTLMSLMDHTPGQRQFAKVEKYKAYYKSKHGVSNDDMDRFIQSRLRDQRRYAQDNRQKLAALARDHDITLASHDDATVEHVQEAIDDGVAIAEFPTTLDAAKAAHANGLQILMGAPNVVLGGSHSGNVSATTLVKHRLVDVMSSDYVPQSLLQAVFLMASQMVLPLHEAVRLVTTNPADAIGLGGDRGSLAVGKLADLITVHHDGTVPCITSVSRRGRCIA